MPTTMSALVKALKAFLQENQTGLIQRSSAWVNAWKHTIGASEIAALTRASPFDTPASLVRKKLHPPDLSQNVACAWGRLFESFAREYIEWKHNTQVFGHTISLNLAKTHPLYGKVTCSPDGYFQDLDESLTLRARLRSTRFPLGTAIRCKQGWPSAESLSPKGFLSTVASGCVLCPSLG